MKTTGCEPPLSEIHAIRAGSIRRGWRGSLFARLDLFVTFNQGLIEPREDELILDPVREPFGSNHIG